VSERDPCTHLKVRGPIDSRGTKSIAIFFILTLATAEIIMMAQQERRKSS